MAPLKRNRSATLAKSPPGSPIRPITKRSRQKTPESEALTSTTLPLPLRPTKPTYTSTPTAFNSSQVDEGELNYKVEKVVKVIVPGKKKTVKQTVIEEVPKGIKQILAERGCLPTGK